MLYKNARIYCSDFKFRHGCFEVVGDRFGEILFDEDPDDAVDLGGATVIPGLIDIHTHGNSGADFSDGDDAGLVKMAGYLAKCGVTSFAPTSMTLPFNQLAKAFENAKKFAVEGGKDLSVLRGVHMEGPYLSRNKCGAQNRNYLRNPDFDEFKKLYDISGGLVKIVDVAPELEGAAAFIENAKKLCTVSVAHTDADYTCAKQAFDMGATHLTHMFNAMGAIYHRCPGVIPAAAEKKNVFAELICDGNHIHPAVIRLAFSLFKDRIILVSDSGRCAGMTDGSSFMLGGQEAVLKDGVARLDDGTIACSSVNLFVCLKNAIAFGVPEEEVIRAVTYNPAVAIGADSQTGGIEKGKSADFVVCDKNYEIMRVCIKGEEIETE